MGQTPADGPTQPPTRQSTHRWPVFFNGPGMLTPSQEAALKAAGQEKHDLDVEASTAMDADQYAQAEDYAQQSMAVGDDGGFAQAILAAALDAEGKTQAALAAYQEMSNTGDVYPRTQLPYALLLLKTGHWAEAVTAYNKQLPILANGKLMNANSHFSPAVPQTKELKKDLETAIHIALGLTEDWRGYNQTTRSHEQTLVQFKMALALEPNSALANYYYGYTLRHLGHIAAAMTAYKKASAFGNADVKSTAETELTELSLYGISAR